MSKIYSAFARHPYRRLASAMRYRVVAKYLGVVLIVLSAAFLVTALVSFSLNERVLTYFFLCPACFAPGLWIYRRVPEREVTGPEAAAVASLSFLAASLVGALPFYLLGSMNALDSWFESMSGFTTTGFSLMDVTIAPRHLIFFRALSQWLGGMGFVVITVGLLLVSGRSAVTFLKDEAKEQVFPRLATHVRAIALTYLALTAAGVAMLVITGLGPLDAVCYTFSGISTGGFAAHAGSVGDLPVAATIPITIIMIVGAAPFIIYYRSWKTGRNLRGKMAALFKDRQLITLILLTTVCGVAISAFDNSGGLLNGIFTAASAQTTTGYSTVDPKSIAPGALVVIIFAMFTGGSLGSTAGGIKLFRFIELFRGLNRHIIIQLYPKELVFPDGSGASVENRTGATHSKEDLPAVFYVIVIYVVLIAIGSAVFVWYGYDPLGSLFEVTSATGTVGLSVGIVSPGLAPALKLIFVFLMWAGRLETIPLLIWVYSLAARPGGGLKA